MKKIFVLLCVGMLLVGAVGCGKSGDGSEESTSQSQGNNTPETSQTPDTPDGSGASTGGNVAADHNYEEGWTEEMEAVKTAVIEKLGDEYWPNMPLTPDLLEDIVGIAPDMYEDYFAEGPMISAHVDTLIVVKAVEDKADEVEEILLGYYEDRFLNNTMQYPQNVGKIQGARVERLGNYVIFSQLGGDTVEISPDGDDDVIIAHCQEVNDLVIEMISNTIQH